MKTRASAVCLLLTALVAAAILPTLPTVKAQTTVTWSSTADFDAGTKTSTTLTGTWTQKSDMTTATADASGIGYNGKLYVFGGATNTLTATNLTQIYNPSTDSWSSGTPDPTARWGMALGLWADRIYVIGGSVTGGASTNLTEYYNVTTNSWTKVRDLALAQSAGICGTSWNGFIYAEIGSTNLQYDPVADVWTNRAQSNSASTWETCATVGNFIYTLGGSLASKTVRRYDPVANTWNNAYGIAPQTFYAGPKDNPVHDGKIWVGFSFESSITWRPFYRVFWAYDPVANTWTRQADAMWPRDGVAAGWAGSKFYVANGRVQSVPLGSKHLEEFDPAMNEADGNTGIETTTENPVVPAGSFRLTSATGDTFSRGKDNAGTFKWNLSVSENGNCHPVIAGGVVYLNLGDATTDWCGVLPDHGFTGNLDAQVKVSAPSGRIPDFHWLNEFCPYYGCDATADGFIVQTTGSPTHTVAGYKVLNGAPTACGAAVASVSDPFWTRINYTVSTTTWGWWTSIDGATWTNRGYCANSATGPFYPILGAQWNGGTGNISYDDFQVTQGTAAAGIYRTSGSWTSATQTATTEMPGSVTLTYSGVSATAYIDAVSIRDSLGNQLWQDDTDITAGTSKSFVLPYSESLRQESWAVRVVLAGDGTASATLEQVDVDMVEPARPPGRVLVIDVSCAYNPFVLTWTCTDHTNYRGFIPENFDTLRYSYDGMEVVTTRSRGATVTFRAPGETWLSTERDHLLIVTWTFYNGGTPSATYVLRVDNRPAQIGMALLGLLLLALVIAAVIRRRGGAIAFERVQNPSYRRTAISVEEYPKGWRSYRQVRHNPNLPTRSERRDNLWIIYQLRSATAAEQQRTGRKRIAYVQTVRERM